MNRFSRLLASALPLALASALGACGSNGPEKAPSGEGAASTAAAPETRPGLSLAGGRLVLPAVRGNPGAAYFTLANGSDKPVTIAAVDVAGAGMAMLHETRQVAGHSEMGELADPTAKPGGTLAFAPGGKHVMVMDLPEGLKPGATVELTLTFADGDKLSAPLAIEGPGGQ